MIDSLKLCKERSLYFMGDVDPDTVCKAIKDINDQDAELKSAMSQFSSLFPGCNIEFPNIKVYINSGGGDVLSCLGYYDFVREFEKDNNRITSVATGFVASAAVPMYLASNHRVAYPSSYFLIHPVLNAIVDFMERLKDEVEFTEKLQNRINKIIVDRTNISIDKLNQVVKENKDWVISADEALELGICHEILYN